MNKYDLPKDLVMVLKLAEESFSNIKELRYSIEVEDSGRSVSFVIELAVDSESKVETFLNEYNSYTKKFVEMVPLEQQGLFVLNYSFY